jgi:hypothetical protein
MGTQVTLTLPDELYDNAKRWAAITQRGLSETLTDALSVVLTPIYTTPENEVPVGSLSDEKVLALTKVSMDAFQGKRMGTLLEKQREGELNEREGQELLALMQVYDHLWVRQSEAFAETVRRGLRAPL